MLDDDDDLEVLRKAAAAWAAEGSRTSVKVYECTHETEPDDLPVNLVFHSWLLPTVDVPVCHIRPFFARAGPLDKATLLGPSSRPKPKCGLGNACCAAVFTATSVAFMESVMNKDQVKGVAEKVKGKANEALGKATGNVSREMKGDVQQEMGQARKNVGDAREAAKDASKSHSKRTH
jgi:uncharacterized protein YjbJ (UPF0337 family)